MTETAVPTVLAVDVFDKFNFTGAWVPRFEDIRDDLPKELASSVFFSADFFKPPERRGKASYKPGLPLGTPAPRAGGGGSGGSWENKETSSHNRARPLRVCCGPP